MSEASEAHRVREAQDLQAKYAHEMQAVMAQLPELTVHGLGIFVSSPTSAEKEVSKQWAKERAKLRLPASLQKYGKAKGWLLRYRWPGNSYELKHEAERAIGYIPNGMFIAAAKAVG